MKTSNNYSEAISRKLFEATPKHVFAAIAVSSLTGGGDYIEEAEKRIMAEWWILFQQGIVPQKPPMKKDAV